MFSVLDAKYVLLESLKGLLLFLETLTVANRK